MLSADLRRRSVMALLALLAGCTATPERPSFPAPSWTHLPPITLDVAEIEIIDATQPTGASPHVEHLFPVPPVKAAERWARDRLRAGGVTNRARFIIQRAEVVEVALPRTEGLSGLFTTEQSERYDGELAVLLEVRSDVGQLLGQVTSELRKSRTAPENADLGEREIIWFAVTDDLVKLLNTEMERTMPQFLGRWIQAR